MVEALLYYTGLTTHPNSAAAASIFAPPDMGDGTAVGAGAAVRTEAAPEAAAAAASDAILAAGSADSELNGMYMVSTIIHSLINHAAAATVVAMHGHLVSITMHYSAQLQGPASRGSKVVSKRSKLVRSDHIRLRDINRPKFIRAFLLVHDLAEQFSPGVHSGPPFKLYWTGSTCVFKF